MNISQHTLPKRRSSINLNQREMKGFSGSGGGGFFGKKSQNIKDEEGPDSDVNGYKPEPWEDETTPGDMNGYKPEPWETEKGGLHGGAPGVGNPLMMDRSASSSLSFGPSSTTTTTTTTTTTIITPPTNTKGHIMIGWLGQCRVLDYGINKQTYLDRSPNMLTFFNNIVDPQTCGVGLNIDSTKILGKTCINVTIEYSGHVDISLPLEKGGGATLSYYQHYKTLKNLPIADCRNIPLV